ncbi:uncharacterized protein Fot_25739 [Forsythia ovata]|uniref:J domain-containing protein n=1 Tax=Forsythia ovata TaxID=205694 RepID=A0ABD1U9W6_9LAMI
MHTRRTRKQPSRETGRLLTAAEYFLTRRNFIDCRKYALRAQESNPSHPAPAQLIAIASVLSAPHITPDRPDYYSILNLPRFTSDPTLIASKFKTLAFVLNPNNNSHPFSSKAHEMVLKARYVLLNPNERLQFDGELRRNQGCNSGTDGGTFWTICPYCYYIYEYDIVFEDCCLRCQNVKCRRGFHAVAIVTAPPPPEVAEEGQYMCPGFIPLGCTKTENYNEGTNREKTWAPFGPTMVPKKADGVSKGECNAKNNEDGLAIDISSDDEMVCAEGFENDKKVEFQNLGSDKKMNIQGENNTMGGIGGYGNANGEKVMLGGENHNGNVENSKKEKGMRRKSVAKSSKKLMGRGLKIDNKEAFFMLGDVEEEGLNEGSEGDRELDTGFGAEMMDAFKIGVDFFKGGR